MTVLTKPISVKKSIQHPSLACGRWAKFSLAVQMANIGAEVGRAVNWRKKGNQEYGQLAFYRALELIDLTLDCQLTGSQYKEICRVREALADYFVGDNIYSSTDDSWDKYFLPFNALARQ